MEGLVLLPGGGGRAGVCGKGPEALLHFERCWERMQMRCK